MSSETSIDNASHLNDRKKRYHSKTAKGCSTCRSRRIKCDETRPSCSRCLRAGRNCPGYDIQIVSFQPRTKSLKPTSRHQRTYDYEDDHKHDHDHDNDTNSFFIPTITIPTYYQRPEQANDLAFFLHRSAPMMSLAASTTGDLWTIIVPQASWQYPELREMLYAYSCLDQHFSSSATDLAMKGQFQLAFQHYNNAIAGLRRGAPLLHNILLSSMVGWMFEMTMCKVDRAQVHICGAQRIIREWDRVKGSSGDYDVVVEAVRAIKLGPNQRAGTDSGRASEQTSDTSPRPDLPTINTLEDAWTTLESAMSDLRIPTLSPVGQERSRQRLNLWSTAFVVQRFRLSSAASTKPSTAHKTPTKSPVTLSAKRPIVLLHKIGLVALELHKHQSVNNVIEAEQRRKHWETVLGSCESVLEFGYGVRIERGVGILVDLILWQARCGRGGGVDGDVGGGINGEARGNEEVLRRARRLKGRLRLVD